MEPLHLHRNLPLLLLQAREVVISHFRPLLNHAGVTEQQWRIIRALHENTEMEPWQICEACQILSPSLAGVLARMEETGLVKRSRIDTDQRRVMVSLTARSKALVKKMGPLVQEQYRLFEESMGPDLVRDLYPVLDRLLAMKDQSVQRVALPEVDHKAAPRKTRRMA